jgi:primosomal protein N'
MALIRFEGQDRSKVFQKASMFKSIMDKVDGPKMLIRGPKSAPLSKLRGKFRIQIIIRTSSRKDLNKYLKTVIKKAQNSGISRGSYIIDIDPYNLM